MNGQENEIMDLARWSGLPEAWISATGVLKWSDLEAFAKLVAAKEREECAKVCEEPWQGSPKEIAKAIRARGEA